MLWSLIPKIFNVLLLLFLDFCFVFMYSGSCIEHCQSNSNILFFSNPLKMNNQTGILMNYRQIHAEEREEWNPKHTTTLLQLYRTAHWMWSLLQVVGPRLWRKNTLFLKDKRFFRFATHKNTSFTQKRNMNAVDLSSSSVSSPTDGGGVELHVLGCATSTFHISWTLDCIPGDGGNVELHVLGCRLTY